MSSSARRVLADCHVALEMLQAEEHPERWRVTWVSMLTLLRGVGNVLLTVDCKTIEQKQVCEQFFRAWHTDAEHAVFQQFIMNGRSVALHDYAPDLDNTDGPGFSFEDVARDEEIKFQFDEFDPSVHKVKSEYRKGTDAREIARDAIDWWEVQLDAFDQESGKQREALQLNEPVGKAR
jgi:hypothetical protein